jgi:hypothetical protein
MVLIGLVLIMILGVALFYFTQGLFSSLVTLLVTIACAAMALTWYQPIAVKFYPTYAAIAPSLTLMLLFGLPLIAMRMLFDWVLVRKNVVFNQWVERIGGAVFGIMIGMIIVGMLVMCLSMLPFGASLIGYRPFDDTLTRQQTLAPFKPLDFLLGTMGKLSGGSLADANSFSNSHADFELREFAYRNRATVKGEAKLAVNNRCPEDAAAVLRVFELPDDHPWINEDWTPRTPAAPAEVAEGETPAEAPVESGNPHYLPKLVSAKNPLLPDDENTLAGSRFVIVRIGVDRSLVGKGKFFQLPATNFRLALPDGRSVYPIGYMTYPNNRNDILHNAAKRWTIWLPPTEDNRLAVRRLVVVRPRSSEVLYAEAGNESVSGKGLVIDWLYRIPTMDPAATDEDAPAETDPMRLIFRRGLQLDLPEPEMLSSELVEMVDSQGKTVLMPHTPPLTGGLSNGRIKK